MTLKVLFRKIRIEQLFITKEKFLLRKYLSEHVKKKALHPLRMRAKLPVQGMANSIIL